MAKEEVGSLYFGLFVASIIPLTLLYIGYASQLVGIILLAVFVFYVYELSKVRNLKEEGALGGERLKLGKYTLLTFLGAAGVVASSYFIVESASYVAEEVLLVPAVVVGATIVAFGTSLPELARSIEATQRGHLDLALGNIIGSCFINTTCILGVTLVALTLRVNMPAFSSLVMFSALTNLFRWYFLSSERISWREGVVLLFMYFVFLTVSFGGYKI